MERNRFSKIWPILLALKYLFSVWITFLAFQTVRDTGYLVMSLCELAVIAGISHVILSVHWLAGHGVHFTALLIYNAQTLVMYFGGSFVTLNMLSNLVFLNDLQGKFGTYLWYIIPMAFFSLIPAKKRKIKRKKALSVFAVSAAAELILLGCFGISRSPVFSLYSLHMEKKNYQNMVREIGESAADASEYYKDRIGDYVRKPETLPKEPNVVLIFVEGLSENIITDSRNIMPNFRDFYGESLYFENYYNHTFATLKGLIGQLYSGYQMENFDPNGLCSLESILKSRGYRTTFINTEPLNADFEGYLESLGFDEVLSEEGLSDTGGNYISDRAAYDLLFDTINAQQKEGTPFFTAIYTFGTHMSLNSPDKVYGDGASSILNRFYNQDYQFSRFLESFKESPLAKDTVLIVTTDHATYSDDDFLSAFPGYDRKSPGLDKIPLYIYHEGVEPGVVDAGGRNSLDLAPTILDYLDISAPNYFLGDSLFAPAEDGASVCDRIFYDSSASLSTKDTEIRPLAEEEYQEFRTLLIGYFRAKGDENLTSVSEEYILAEVSEDAQIMTVTLKSRKNYDRILFPVWSETDWQDDLIWHEASKNEEGEWSCVIDLSEHSGMGIYYIHAYKDSEIPENMVTATWVNISGPNEP